jgi:hypothetical protein
MHIEVPAILSDCFFDGAEEKNAPQMEAWYI